MILNYEQRGKHSTKFPKHKNSILTSSQFASEIQFYHIAYTNNKVVEKADGSKLIIQPCLFDPKKGTGDIKMLEQLCREMHDPKHEQEQFVEEDNLESITNQSQAHEVEAVLPSAATSAPKKSDEQRRLMQIDTSVDEMIKSLTEFEQNVHAQLYLSINMYPQNQFDMYWQPQSYHKMRKVSETDYISNCLSAESTLHPNLTSAEVKYHNTQYLVGCESDKKRDIGGEPGYSPLMGLGRTTAFEPYRPSIKEVKERKLYKPVPLPSLNRVSASL